MRQGSWRLQEVLLSWSGCLRVLFPPFGLLQSWKPTSPRSLQGLKNPLSSWRFHRNLHLERSPPFQVLETTELPLQTCRGNQKAKGTFPAYSQQCEWQVGSLRVAWTYFCFQGAESLTQTQRLFERLGHAFRALRVSQAWDPF